MKTKSPTTTRRKVLYGALVLVAIVVAGNLDNSNDEGDGQNQLAAVSSNGGTPEPPATLTDDQIRVSYGAPSNPNEVFVRADEYQNRPVQLRGSVNDLKIAVEGHGYEIGDSGFLGLGGDTRTYRSVMILYVTGTSETMVVGFSGDLLGIYDGDEITVYGSIVGTSGTTNAFGASADRPLFEAVLIDHDGIGSKPSA